MEGRIMEILLNCTQGVMKKHCWLAIGERLPVCLYKVGLEQIMAAVVYTHANTN